ncbi:MAG: VOC family protein [Anaerolineales bacterium]|jgi:predicted enzyme related to lactoylglutathione lyase
MAKALGVGGIFFKSVDPKKLYHWYERWLGFQAEPGSGFAFPHQDMPKDSVTVWSAFESKTDYFAPSAKEYMFNLIVDDLSGALQQVKEGGAEIVGDIQEYEFGKFGWFMDPEGNKVELWELPASGE